MAEPSLQASNGDDDEEKYESTHVHSVYDEIAPHFSATRYKPWPLISAFLSALSAGSVGLDAGCGNGKYLNVNPNIYILASDTSLPLLNIAHRNTGTSPSVTHGSNTSHSTRRPHPSSDVVQASTISLPHPSSRLDFAISIAVVHHLSTRQRRVEAVRALLGCLKPREYPVDSAMNTTPKAEDVVKMGEGDAERIRTLVVNERGGMLLVFVWALEQKGSRRGWDRGMEQDVMVPWVMKGYSGGGGVCEGNIRKKGRSPGGKVEGKNQETEEDVDGKVGKDVKVEAESEKDASRDKTFYRYYHLYKRGELEEDVKAAGGKVVDGGWERDNWWVVAVRKQ